MLFRIIISFGGILDGSNLPQPSADAARIEVLLNWFFVIAAVISFLVIVIAGFQFIISSGEPEKIAKARRTILYALVGLIVSLSSAAIVSFVVARLT